MLRRTWTWIACAIAAAALAGCDGGKEPPDGNGGAGGSTTTTTADGGGGAGQGGGGSGQGGGGGPSAVCGNSQVEMGEGCDDGNTSPADGCDGMCAVEDGFNCLGEPSDCLAICGDAQIVGNEVCDDGNETDGDGCGSDCTVEAGFTCSEKPSVCTPKCGDAMLAGDEACDDGDLDAGDGCSDTCAIEDGFQCSGEPSVCTSTCGDGNIASDETCDDGNTNEADGCDSTCDNVEKGWSCMGEPSVCSTTCGDNTIAGEETCDDGDADAGDGCSAACVTEPGWTCTGEPSVCNTTCGDGDIAGTEVCDDHNTTNGDGCSNLCVVEAGWMCVGEPSFCTTTCGDGVQAGTETCDDANTASGDGCSGACKVELGYMCAGAPSVCTNVCGDGIIIGGEQCDDGGSVSGDGCSASCLVETGWLCLGQPSGCDEICGDGQLVGAEQCDDANKLNGDGCDSICHEEGGFDCAGQPSVCDGICGDNLIVQGETCDDGNLVGGDCCASDCSAEAGCEIEPNNVPGTANDYDSLTSNGVLKATIKPVGDIDCFKVDVASPVDLKIETFDGTGAPNCATGTDTVVRFYDPNGTQLGNDDDDGPGNCSMITPVTDAWVRQLQPNSYYFCVEDFGNNGTIALYQTVVTFTTTCGNGVKEGFEQCDGTANCSALCTIVATCGDNFVSAGETCDDGNTVGGDGCAANCQLEGLVAEVEPNNVFADADASTLQISNDAYIQAAIGSVGDKDIYRLQVPTAGRFRFETFDASATDCLAISTTIRLFSQAQVQLYTDTTTGIGNCSALVVNLLAGTYYVQVEESGNDAAIAGYILEVNYQADGGLETEVNDTPNLANPFPNLALNVNTCVQGFHQTVGDLDVYSINVPVGASVRAETIEGGSETCESNGIDSRIQFLDAAGVQLIDDDDSGRGFCSQIDGTGAAPKNAPAHGLAGGTYYLRVAATGTGAGAQFDYRLCVTIRSP